MSLWELGEIRAQNLGRTVPPITPEYLLKTELLRLRKQGCNEQEKDGKREHRRGFFVGAIFARNFGHGGNQCPKNAQKSA